MERLEQIKRSTDFTTEHGHGLYIDVLSANDFNWMIHRIESLSEENEQLQRDNKHLAKEYLELKRSYAQTARKLKKSREDRQFAKNELDKLKRLTGGVLK